MNICLFSIKLPILVKICPTVTEILTLYECSPKACLLSYLRSMKLTDVNINTICRIGRTKANKMVFSVKVSKILF